MVAATNAELDGPGNVTVDSAGNLFIADGGNNVIREVVKATGDIITVAGNGTAGSAATSGSQPTPELGTGLAISHRLQSATCSSLTQTITWFARWSRRRAISSP